MCWCLHAATFTWSHVMWSSDIRQDNSLCSTDPSRRVFSCPHYTTSKQTQACWALLLFRGQLLAVRWRNVTPSHWKYPVNGQCRFQWSFCLLSFMMDWGPASAHLDLCVLIRGECAAQQYDGDGDKSKVRHVDIYLETNRQHSRCPFHYP